MSSDNQFTSLGPAAVGFQTHGANIDVGADISGNSVGVKGTCQGPVGDGVQGHASGNFSGVAGFGGNNSGSGVFGVGGNNRGVGVRGLGFGASNTDPGIPAGVFGHGGSGAPGVIGQAGDGIADGVAGHATGNFSGVAGFGGPNAGTGVFGAGGVSGQNLTGPGIRGIGGGGPNTVPLRFNNLVMPVGVYGNGGDAADGVQGVAGPGASAAQSFAGVHGIGGHGSPDPNLPASYAGLFDGAVLVNGNLTVKGSITKGGGSFQIDHPLDPDNKYLVHSFVEAPERKNVYDGVAVADMSGEALVELPTYFDALNTDFRYQLTPIGAPAPNLHIKQELIRNRFVIAGACPRQRVCWQVTGIRQDAWAQANPLVVELEKPKLGTSNLEHIHAARR